MFHSVRGQRSERAAPGAGSVPGACGGSGEAERARELADTWGVAGRWLAAWPVAANPPSAPAELAALLDAAPAHTLELMRPSPGPEFPMPDLPLPEPVSLVLAPGPWVPFVLRVGPLTPWWTPLAGWVAEWRRFLPRVLGSSLARRSEVRLDLYLASPGAVSRFHADPSHNLVQQVAGARKIRIFSPLDERLVHSQSRPGIYLERGMHPKYRRDCEDAARELALDPGTAAYVPPRAGHWVQNGPEFSISYTVSLRTPVEFREKYCHAMNARLRSLGFAPRLFGERPLADSAKARMEWLLRRARLGGSA